MEELESQARYWKEQIDSKGNTRYVFKPKRLADDINKNYYILTMEDNEEVYVYDKESGVYKNNGEQLVKTLCRDRIGEELTKVRFSETLFHVKIDTYTPRDQINQDIYLLHLQNGVYDLRENDLTEFDPEIRNTVSLPVKFNPELDCPNFKRFLSEVVNEDDIPLLQEIFGYCLLREMPFHKAVMLTGSGSNGKSTLLNVLQTLLGKDNTTGVALQNFEVNRFAIINLYGKLANIYPDLPDKALKHTGVFKIVTGGDSILAEKKFRNPFEFVNYAKLIFSANKLPETFDDSDAFFRRWIIINFPFSFEGKNANENLLKELTTSEELSGIFNWSIEGLKRLLEQRQFTTSNNTEKLREEYTKKSNPLKAFYMDCIEEDSDGFITKDDFYGAFVEYCKENRAPISSKDYVSKHIQEVIPSIRSSKKTLDGVRVHCWQGVQPVQGIPYLNHTGEKSDSIYSKVKEKVGQHGQAGLEDFSVEVEDLDVDSD